ncbi:MAG: hypothetical protein J6I73_04635 [Treponema sp.]|nr:hypothetical protein [Treponema sp.]
MSQIMNAVVLIKPTEAKDITLTDIPVPQVRAGWVLVKSRAFGMNHNEQILRQFEIGNDYIAKPIVPVIECAGEVADITEADAAALARGAEGSRTYDRHGAKL